MARSAFPLAPATDRLMTPDGDHPVVLAELPHGARWEFGGYPYGLEPLTLPPPAERDYVAAHDASALPELCARIGRIATSRASEPLNPCGADDGLFWFRWLTGHQVSFVIWHLIAQQLVEAQERSVTAVALSSLTSYVRAYCAMLLYTGSCPRSTYHRVIRPSMRLRHPSFSGSWAPDYAPIRDLLRKRHFPFPASSDSLELLEVIRLQRVVHDAVAAKLVPDGRSLLQQSPVRRQDMRLLNVIYDNYFLTLRAHVPRHEVVAQLLRRLVAIAQDLAANGLHPANALEPSPLPAEFALAEVIACEEQLPEILVNAATCATAATERPARAGAAVCSASELNSPTGTPVLASALVEDEP